MSVTLITFWHSVMQSDGNCWKIDTFEGLKLMISSSIILKTPISEKQKFIFYQNLSERVVNKL